MAKLHAGSRLGCFRAKKQSRNFYRPDVRLTDWGVRGCFSKASQTAVGEFGRWRGGRGEIRKKPEFGKGALAVLKVLTEKRSFYARPGPVTEPA